MILRSLYDFKMAQIRSALLSSEIAGRQALEHSKADLNKRIEAVKSPEDLEQRLKAIEDRLSRLEQTPTKPTARNP